ncbi:MAG: hypothetical protein GY811_18560 [Myxococcales bacterium]|nr:hypothetical protein [Myxococcales bacterium]
MGRTKKNRAPRFRSTRLRGLERPNDPDADDSYTSVISSENTSIQKPTGIAGNLIAHGDTGNLFTGDTPMSYEVSILNNSDDTGYAAGTDADGIVILRVVGRGPGTAAVVLDVNGGDSVNTHRVLGPATPSGAWPKTALVATIASAQSTVDPSQHLPLVASAWRSW